MMKKNEKRKNSTMKKLIPAAGMLALSASMLATSTYAWFTMNTTVTVTGMELKTKVGSNLLICDTNLEADYTTALTQTRLGILEPVSSVTGQTGSFYYTLSAKANGDATADVYTLYDPTAAATGETASSYGNKFSQDYGLNTTEAGQMVQGATAASGYVDYTFYLKAISDKADQEIVMTDCNLLYGGAAINDASAAAVDKDNAWRVAVFATDITANGGKGTTGDAASVGSLDPAAIPSPAAATAKNILTRSGAGNQDGTKAVSAPNAAPSVSAVYNSWDADNIGVIDTLGATKYYKVVVRVWLEGEDTSCKTSTYAPLTNAYTLSAKFELKDSNAATGVANILSAT